MENYKDMGNADLKLLLNKVQDEFETKKNEIIKLCKELETIQNKYNEINNEINLRKNVF